jgi:hypothetical protein
MDHPGEIAQDTLGKAMALIGGDEVPWHVEPARNLGFEEGRALA